MNKIDSHLVGQKQTKSNTLRELDESMTPKNSTNCIFTCSPLESSNCMTLSRPWIAAQNSEVH